MASKPESIVAKEPTNSRERAEATFNKAQRTTDEARSVTDTELSAARKKTERLREQRLAREAQEAVTELDRKKPARKRTR